MANNKHKSVKAKNEAFITSSKNAENNVAETTDRNRRQKGHVPNSPPIG
ncbi:hypothetical protein [Paenibacillus harenae]|nr:hypothetical protein [Paenibacillus harenae]